MMVASLCVISKIAFLINACSGFTPPTLNSHQKQQRQNFQGIFPLDASTVEDVATARSTLSKLALADSTQTKLTPEQVAEYNAAIEGLPPPPPLLDVDGGWE